MLEFLDYFIDPLCHVIEECMERGLTYAVPLKAKSASANDEEHVDFRPSWMFSLEIFLT
jgi:DNA-directed RNA polymerase subunit beta